MKVSKAVTVFAIKVRYKSIEYVTVAIKTRYKKSVLVQKSK